MEFRLSLAIHIKTAFSFYSVGEIKTYFSFTRAEGGFNHQHNYQG
jgi:hypothetical protein